MNAHRLTQLYSRLAVWERIPLLLAAEARGDDAEYRRLFDAAPLRACHFAEHLLAEQAVHVLALTYIGEQLDAAANYFFALFQMANADAAQARDWRLAADACAYFFTTNRDAWRRLCADLAIDPAALTAANHPGGFLRYCEEHIPEHAPSREDLEAALRTSGRDDAKLVTADTLRAGWRSALQAMTRHAPPEFGERNP